jgi:hypothetical protein
LTLKRPRQLTSSAENQEAAFCKIKKKERNVVGLCAFVPLDEKDLHKY